MPWKVMPDHDGCAFAVVKESDGSTVACHKDRASADGQVRALYASESFAVEDHSGPHASARKNQKYYNPKTSGQIHADRGMRGGVGGGGAAKTTAGKLGRGGGGGGRSFAARVDAVEQALCAMADVLYERRTEEFSDDPGGVGGRRYSRSYMQDRVKKAAKAGAAAARSGAGL